MVPGYQPSGLVMPGNIDILNRPRAQNPDGSVSSVRSRSFNIDGVEVLLPTVSEDGRIMSDQETVETYRQTGRHLGMFAAPEAATSYAQILHKQQHSMMEISRKMRWRAQLPNENTGGGGLW
jgi:hypothetical protein